MLRALKSIVLAGSVVVCLLITPAHPQNEVVIHPFHGAPNDGASPRGDLVNVGNILYGTTDIGGAGSCSLGCGTVFEITTAGNERVLHPFPGTPKPANPHSGLIEVDGTLYGTTSAGGAYGKGTVFKLTTAGVPTLLYSFQGGPKDGDGPSSSLIEVSGTLYGTTGGGGENGYGTVFKITTAGKNYNVLRSFKGAPDDGAYPWASLIDFKGTLYGTTYSGGSYNKGTVFKITTAGKKYNVLHSFKGAPDDGALPWTSLIDFKGTLYGTTLIGGSGTCDTRLIRDLTNALNAPTLQDLPEHPGCGTVFTVTQKGGVVPLALFQGAPKDGALPRGDLVNVGDTLYGTTVAGGTGNCHAGCGTVFTVTPKRGVTVRNSFLDKEPYPIGRLINVDGTLYGTTSAGGAYGKGTVFKLAP
jgi:uncharacterized repeat protein (TIGR03803 family)